MPGITQNALRHNVRFKNLVVVLPPSPRQADVVEGDQEAESDDAGPFSPWKSSVWISNTPEPLTILIGCIGVGRVKARGESLHSRLKSFTILSASDMAIV